MFQNLTNRAQQVMRLARQVAIHFNHDEISPEHILLGLIKEEAGVGVEMLKEFHIDPRRIRLEVEKNFPAGSDMLIMGNLPLNAVAKTVLDDATQAATTFDNKYVGSEHLLLGLLMHKKGVAYEVLTSFGLTYENVHAALEDRYRGPVEPSESTATSAPTQPDKKTFFKAFSPKPGKTEVVMRALLEEWMSLPPGTKIESIIVIGE